MTDQNANSPNLGLTSSGSPTITFLNDKLSPQRGQHQHMGYAWTFCWFNTTHIYAVIYTSNKIVRTERSTCILRVTP